MDSCLASLIKYLLYITNLLVFALAVTILGLSCWALVDGDSLQDLINLAGDEWDINIYSSAAVLFIVVSSCITVVAFLGCYGARRESKCALGLYIMVMGALAVTLIAGAVLGMGQAVQDNLEKPLYKTLARYNEDSLDSDVVKITKNWDDVMKDFSCCGVQTFKDWENNNTYFGPEMPYHVPRVCCTNIANVSLVTELITACRGNPADFMYYPEMTGCSTKLVDEINKHADVVGAIAITIILVITANLVFATAVCFGINRGKFA